MQTLSRQAMMEDVNSKACRIVTAALNYNTGNQFSAMINYTYCFTLFVLYIYTEKLSLWMLRITQTVTITPDLSSLCPSCSWFMLSVFTNGVEKLFVWICYFYLPTTHENLAIQAHPEKRKWIKLASILKIENITFLQKNSKSV